MLENKHWQIPEHTFEALKRYVEEGIPTGDFLYAMLTNDLFGAIGRADSQNSRALKDICGFVYNEIPSTAWHTDEAVKQWIEHQGLKKINKEAS